MMKLFCSSTSPFARKVTLCADLLGLTDQIERIVIATNVLKPDPRLAAHNPMIKLPALVLEHGDVLYDSRVICEYLSVLTHDNQLFPSGEQRWQALTWQATGDGLLDAGLVARYEMAFRPKEYQWDAWFQAQMKKVAGCMQVIDQHADSLAVTQLTIGEVAIICALGFLDFRFPEMAWRPQYPQAAAWFGEVSHLPAVKNSVPVA